MKSAGSWSLNTAELLYTWTIFQFRKHFGKIAFEWQLNTEVKTLLYWFKLKILTVLDFWWELTLFCYSSKLYDHSSSKLNDLK